MKQEQEIFEQAIALPSREARDGFLLKACGENRQLRGSVDELLAAFSDAGALDFLHTGGHAEGKETILESPLDEGPGTLIGRYKLLQEIGEGGCGVVYMAEQEEPVRRRVALKVIKLGMDTKSVIARFEAERQALALMDHPNIARVLDAGATDAGRPYFVMELVRGIKITEYCDQNNLSTRDRLDLFIKVCQAIQHAHQKGIIHRDIKPSNILVTLHDGVPVPKVIDFGIAKATSDQRLTDKTLFTALEQFVGTPAYMSPEQAEMSGLDIDTRCDIYSLGVLLYEMLTGQTPFDAKELLASGLDKMRRTIREQEPVRPSTRLNTMLEGELTATARHRQTDAPKLVHLLRGDVDWIVMKCLEKDRTRRYETASGLASDLHRHLNNEAVLARPPSATYRFQKLVRRNKLAFAAAAAIATVLVLGVIVSTWQMVRATQAKKDAVEQRQAADNNAGKARQAEQKAERAAATVTRNLYFAEMNLAGNAAAEPGGISRVADLTAKWIPENGNIDQRGWEWSYLRSLLHQDLFTLRGHTQDVTSVVWSPDGTRLASGSADNTIKIWDIASRQAILVLIGHTGEVNAVSWSPDGKYLSSCGEDKTIKIWDATNGREIGTLHGHTNGVKSVAWSPDGTRLASGSDDGTVKVWNANSGAIVTQIEHSNGVLSVAWSPDGKRLASGDHDRTIKIWDATSGQVIYTLSGHNDGRVAVSWSPDGKRLASGGADFMVRIWDAVARTNLNTLVGHLGVVKSVLWSPDGHFLASASTDGTIKIWDAANGRPINIVRGHMGHVNTAAWSPDGKFLASGSRDHTIKVWDATTEETLTLRGHTGNVWSVAWSPDGKRLASASYDNSVKIWDPDSGQESRTLSGHTDEVNSVAWSPDGKHLASSSDDNTIKIWDAASGQEALATLAGHRASIMTVAWSPDGKRLASASGDGTAKVWDMTSMRETRTFRAHSNAVHSVSWSPDGKLLASGSWDQTVKIWDPESGREVRTLNRPSGQEVTLVRWSPDGKRLAAASFDGTSTVWDAVSGQIIHTMRGHSGGVVSVSWSPDGKRLASGSSDNAIKIWDAASGQEILTLRGHTLNVQSVSWSPDGKRLASGSYDHTVKIWDARKGYALERE